MSVPPERLLCGATLRCPAMSPTGRAAARILWVRILLVEESAVVFGNTASRQGGDVYFAGKTLKAPDNTAGIGGEIYFVGKAPTQAVGGGDGDK